MGRILVTGFEPFGNHNSNISKDVLAKVPEMVTVFDPWRGLRNTTLQAQQIYVEKIILTVDNDGSNAIAKRLDEGEIWDAIIHLGLCDSCNKIRLETTAKNNLDMTWDCSNGVIAAACKDEVIDAAEKSGCIGVNIGTESGDRDVLKSVRKPGTVENFLKADIIIIEPVASEIGSPAPIAAAIGSSINCTLLAPAASALS